MIVVACCAALAAALLVYHRLERRAKTLWLLLLSYGFYAWLAWQFLPVLLGLTGLTYVIARRVAAPEHGAGQRGSGLAVYAGVGLNVLALALLRYGYDAAPFERPFAVLGVSFYTLQAIAYVLDRASGVLRVPHSLADFALYLAYFPKIIAGPIERPQPFLAQLQGPGAGETRALPGGCVDDARWARALTCIAVGLTRKLLIADPLSALLPAGAFSEPRQHGVLLLIAAIVGYSFVLYNDFAGYTAIARGVSALFGIELSPNFARPHAARSVNDFWNRWHITLSHWLRDYVYLPLSRRLLRRNLSRWNVANLIVPPFVTMLASGLWHGLRLHMLVWGGLHATLLVIERIWALWRSGRKRGALALGRSQGDAHNAGAVPIFARLKQILIVVAVFALLTWTFVIFRLPVERAVEFWHQLLSGPWGGAPEPRLLLFMLASVWLDWMQARHGEDTVFWPWPQPARAALLAAAMLLWLAMFAAAPARPFVYQGF